MLQYCTVICFAGFAVGLLMSLAFFWVNGGMLYITIIHYVAMNRALKCQVFADRQLTLTAECVILFVLATIVRVIKNLYQAPSESVAHGRSTKAIDWRPVHG